MRPAELSERIAEWTPQPRSGPLLVAALLGLRLSDPMLSNSFRLLQTVAWRRRLLVEADRVYSLSQPHSIARSGSVLVLVASRLRPSSKLAV